MIEGVNLQKKYGDIRIFDGFHFKIDDEDYVCFSGDSGSGKSTLLNMIGQIESIDSGVILFDGKRINGRKARKEFFGRKIGFIFQNFALIENKTVQENLELIPKENRTQINVKQALRIVGVEDKLNAKVYTLSGGEQQRVALARLFLKKSEIILADEPTGSLDRKNAEIVMQILEYLNSLGKTLVIVTHDPDIKMRARRVIDLMRGSNRG